MDDVVVLAGFYADTRVRARHVTTGQFLGMGILFGVCAAASLLSALISPRYLGLAGFAPVALGLVKLWEISRRQALVDAPAPSQAERRSNALGKTLSVTVATLGNSSDALGVWTPVMAIHARSAIPLFGLTFAAMTGLWCFAAFWLVHHPTLGAPIRRFAHLFVPFVLLGLGVFVLASAGSFQLIEGWM
jgi:cadmium resistance protein CadD (predicted permease)